MRTIRSLGFHLLGRTRRSSLRSHLAALEKTQTCSPEELVEWQHERLFDLLCHARDTTVFYKSLIPIDFAPSSAEAVLHSLPVISRQQLRSESKNFLSNEYRLRQLRLQHTSGSTGIPLSFWRDRDSLLRQKAEVVYFAGWAGYETGCSYMYVGPSRSRIRGWMRNESSMWSTYPSEAWFQSLARELENRSVEILIAHPSVLIPFARFVSEASSPSSRPRLRGVISFAEPLSPAARSRIEDALGCPVLRRYSTRELGVVASECEEKRYHVNVGSNYLECLKLDEDQRCRDGEPGRAVITSLDNYGMPFIRYDTGDVVVLERTPCTCYRRSPILRSVEGRVLDAITTPDGRRVEGFDICEEFEDFPEVDQFQFTQLRDGTYRISIVSSSSSQERVERRIARRFQRMLGDSAMLCIRRVESIPPSPSGKTPPICRET